MTNLPERLLDDGRKVMRNVLFQVEDKDVYMKVLLERMVG